MHYVNEHRVCVSYWRGSAVMRAQSLCGLPVGASVSLQWLPRDRITRSQYIRLQNGLSSFCFVFLVFSPNLLNPLYYDYIKKAEIAFKIFQYPVKMYIHVEQQ